MFRYHFIPRISRLIGAQSETCAIMRILRGLNGRVILAS